uniref:Portal protein n=1 Tax=viral metagenome TaxID=1070528 RepID=A0A6M3IG90_9ZZZZ
MNEDEQVQNEGDQNSITAFPDESNAPDEGTLPSRYGSIHNLAEDDALTEQFRQWASAQITRFADQDQRQQFVKSGGVMDMADRMWRVSLNRDTTNKQTKETLSDVTSPMFHVQVRAIDAAEAAILFPDDNLPAEYVPEVNTTEYSSDQGKFIAQQQNMLEEFTFDEDRRREKVKEVGHYSNKYGVSVFSIEWIRRTREITEHVPDTSKGVRDNGTWVAFKRITHRRTIKDWPVMMRHPIENCYFDSMIQNINDQRCFGVKQRCGIEEIRGMQVDGYYLNAGKLTAAQLYHGETQRDAPIEQRQENAGETAETQETGEIELWQVWGRVPIAERTTPKTKKRKGKWDAEKNEPELYWGVYAGDIHSGKSVCLKLVKNPNWHGQIPYNAVHSHPDDKGFFNSGFAQMMESLYWQAVTNLNQAIDNVTERNWAPFVGKGQIFTRDLTFRKNKLIKLSPSAELDRLVIPDTTTITMAMHSVVEQMTNQLTGADKPIRAEALGSRTTATEAKNVFEMATQPLDAKAGYFAAQVLPWMYEIDAHLWRQYGDPDNVMQIAHSDAVYEINPTELWGPIKTKIVAVTRFQNNVIERQDMNSFLQNVMPSLMDAMGPSGKRVLGRELFRIFKIPKAEEIFPMKGDYDAEAIAYGENNAMIGMGQWDEPSPDENHAAHLNIHKPALRQLALLPDPPDKERMDLLRAHIQIHEDFIEQETRQLAPTNAQRSPAQLEGEAMGDRMGAQMGAMA